MALHHCAGLDIPYENAPVIFIMTVVQSLNCCTTAAVATSLLLGHCHKLLHASLQQEARGSLHHCWLLVAAAIHILPHKGCNAAAATRHRTYVCMQFDWVVVVTATLSDVHVSVRGLQLDAPWNVGDTSHS